MDALLLTPREAAVMLRVGRTTMYALLASGEVPSIRIGRSVRVPLDALRTWIAANMHDTDEVQVARGAEFHQPR